MELEDFKEKLIDAYEGDLEGLLNILEVDIRDLLNKLDDEVYAHRDSFPWIVDDPVDLEEGELFFGE